MCEFVSWIEKDNKNYYLTKNQLKTDKGKNLIKYCDGQDIQGHGAIRRYFWGNEQAKGGVDKECSNFSTPLNFPKEIVKDLLNGNFNHKLFDLPLDILNNKARKEYLKIKQSEWKEYLKIKQLAWEEYDKKRQLAFYKLLKAKKNRKDIWNKII